MTAHQIPSNNDSRTRPERRLRSGHWLVIALLGAGLLGLGTIAYFEKTTRETRETYWQVHADLRAIAAAGQQYLLEYDRTEVRFVDIVPRYLDPPAGAPAAVYEHLVVRERGQLRVVLPNQVEVFYDYR